MPRAGRADAEVAAGPGCSAVAGAAGEEVVAGIEAGGGKDLDLAQEQAVHLVSARGGWWRWRRSPWAARAARRPPRRPDSSTAVSYRPTSVPSGPLIRCSSSWMIRSGGRSGPAGLRPDRGEGALLGMAVAVLDLRRAVAMARAVAVHLAEQHLRSRPSRASGRTCPPWRSAARAGGGRSPRPPPRAGRPSPGDWRSLNGHSPSGSPQ